MPISAIKAKARLLEGNALYQKGEYHPDVSKAKLESLVAGQSPFAAILTCSDSRVVPEAIFACSLGELFVIRSAGNTCGKTTLGSIAYAIRHLGTKLIVVLAHSSCGAIGAAMKGNNEEFIEHIVRKISPSIEGISDPIMASKANAIATAKQIEKEGQFGEDALILPAFYDLESGEVTFLW